MPTYEFICKKCKKKKEIIKPMSDSYRPECCEKTMARVYYAPNIVAGCLNSNNLGGK